MKEARLLRLASKLWLGSLLYAVLSHDKSRVLIEYVVDAVGENGDYCSESRSQVHSSCHVGVTVLTITLPRLPDAITISMYVCLCGYLS